MNWLDVFFFLNEESRKSEEGMKNCHHDLISINIMKWYVRTSIFLSNIKAMPRLNPASVYNCINCDQLRSLFKKLKYKTLPSPSNLCEHEKNKINYSGTIINIHK